LLSRRHDVEQRIEVVERRERLVELGTVSADLHLARRDRLIDSRGAQEDLARLGWL
jgi:hypothetical protein